MKTPCLFPLLLLVGTMALRVEAQTTETFSFTGINQPIPDGTAAGLSVTRTNTSAVVNVSRVRVLLHIAGEFNGDLYGYLRHGSGFSVLLNRPGRSTGSTHGYDDAGFDVTLSDDATTDLHVYRTTTTPAAGTPLLGSWKPDSRNVDPDVVLDTTPRTATLAAFNGLDANGEWTLFLADLESGGTNMLVSWEIEVTGAVTPVVTWANPADIVYGTTLGAAHLNASSPVAGAFAYNPPLGTVLHAGSAQTLQVTFTATDGASYVPVTRSVLINVLKKALTITADNKSKVYGAALPALTASYSGFVNGDNAASLDTPVAPATSASASSAAGSYAITANGAADSDYAITPVNGTLTVTPAPLTITADNKSKVYGAALPALTAGYSGFVNGDGVGSLGPGVTLTTSATAASDAGSYPINASGAAHPNYTISHVAGTLTITKAPLTITANNATKVYGAPLPSFTASYSGFVNGNTAANLDTPVTLTTTATAGSPAGAYPITPAGAMDLNYTITFVNGTLTVTKSATAGSLISSLNPSRPGEVVTFTLTATPLAPGAGVPGGSAIFKFDGAAVGTPVVLTGGAAALNRSDLPVGTHTLVVEYAGDDNFVGTTNTLSPNQVVNTPPMAGADTIERWPTNGAKVLIADLLGNDSDADGHALTFASFSATSANGGTVTRSGNWIHFTPALGFTNVDSFTYTISDGHGGDATGTVTVAVRVDTGASSNLHIADLGNGSYRIRVNGIPGRSYRVQFSTSVAGPFWTTLSTGIADGLGIYDYLDSPPPAPPSRFYRAVSP